jgi:hypothetical protein
MRSASTAPFVSMSADEGGGDATLPLPARNSSRPLCFFSGGWPPLSPPKVETTEIIDWFSADSGLPVLRPKRFPLFLFRSDTTLMCFPASDCRKQEEIRVLPPTAATQTKWRVDFIAGHWTSLMYPH